MATNEYLIVGADQSQYTHKVRAYLRNNGIPWRDVGANPQIFKTVILPNAPYALIPDLIVVSKETKEFQVIQDSKLIFEYLEKTHGIPGVVGTKRAFADMVLEMVFDDFFYLSITIYRFGQPKQQKYLEYTFGDNSQPFDKACMIGSKVMGLIGGRTTTLGVTPKTIPLWKEKLRVFLDLINEQLQCYQYLMGNYPTKIDYSVYGQLEATLMRDPVPYEWIVTEYPLVHAYMGRVGGTSVRWGSSNHVEITVEGGKLVSCDSTMGRNRGGKDVEKLDEIPEAMSKLGGILLKDYVTVLEPTIKATLQFLNGQGGKDEVVIPRALKSQIEFSLFDKGGSELKEKKLVTTHCVWMVQRILDSTYKQELRAEADKWLEQIGCLEQWKSVVKAWEEGGWRVELKKEGTVAYKRSTSSKL